MKPPFRADQVGSLLRPAELTTARAKKSPALKEIQVPPVAAELAVGDRFKADRLLLRHDLANRPLLYFTESFLSNIVLSSVGKISGSQKTAHLVGAKRRLHDLNLPWRRSP